MNAEERRLWDELVKDCKHWIAKKVHGPSDLAVVAADADLRALRTALDSIIDSNYIAVDVGNRLYCRWCKYEWWKGGEERHDYQCPVAIAREALALGATEAREGDGGN